MGKNQLRLLRFCLRFPGWQTIGVDSRATARSLEALGLLERGIGNTWRLALGETPRKTLDDEFMRLVNSIDQVGKELHQSKLAED